MAMMEIDCETDQFQVCFDPRYGVGFIRRTADKAGTPLLIGDDMANLRCDRKNATSERKGCRPFRQITDAFLSEFF